MLVLAEAEKKAAFRNNVTDFWAIEMKPRSIGLWANQGPGLDVLFEVSRAATSNIKRGFGGPSLGS